MIDICFLDAMKDSQRFTHVTRIFRGQENLGQSDAGAVIRVRLQLASQLLYLIRFDIGSIGLQNRVDGIDGGWIGSVLR